MNLVNDLRHAARQLGRAPGFSIPAILTIALGIAACTTIFALADGVLLRPLPFDRPEMIVGFWGGGSWSRGELQFVRDEAQSYDHVAAFTTIDLALTGLDEPLAVQAGEVSWNVFTVLGSEADLGRTFLPEEETPGNSRVVILGHGLWRETYGGDPAIIGKTIRIDDTPFEVAGVMKRDFSFPTPETRLWIPITMDPSRGSYRGGHYLDLIGRLRSGVTLRQARAELAALVPRLADEFDLRDGFDKLAAPPTVTTFHDQIVEDVRPALILLLAAVGLVLLIGCANVANLLMARAVRRSREIAIRSALGAGRGRLVRQLLTESALMALLGGGLGLGVAWWGVEMVILNLPADSPRLSEIALDGRVMFFSVGLSALTVFLFGLVPALRGSRVNLRKTLVEGRGGAGIVRGGWRRGLVISEIALAVMLTVSAGLLARSFLNLNGTDPGFSTESVITMKASLALDDYDDRARQIAFYDAAIERIGSLPGVVAAGANWRLPIADSGAYQLLEIEGQTPAPDEAVRQVYWRSVEGNYFEAMGIPLVEGRTFESVDSAGGLPVCVINASMAERFWPEGGAVGSRIRNSIDDDTWITIAGVVGDVRHDGLDRGPGFMMYRPFRQVPSWVSDLSFVVRAGAGDPAGLARSLREAIRQIDPRVPVHRVLTMKEILSASIGRMRLTTWSIIFFGAVAAGLAALGTFGVLSFSVSQRTHEMGVRMALGARPTDLFGLVIKEGMVPAAFGAVLGLAGALALTRLMRGLLFGVEPSDPLTFAAVPVLVMLVALTACCLPARRAASSDPMTALRYE